MKKTKLLLSLPIITLLFFSCSNNDDTNDSKINGEIYGKWKISSSIYNGQTENLDACELLETLEFFENNKLDIDEYDIVGNNTDCTPVGSSDLINYSKSNDILTWTNPAGGFSGGEFTLKFYIRELTEQKLKLELFYELDGFGNDGNVPNDEIVITSYTKIN